MKKVIILLLSAILLGNSYSQNTENSFFSLNQVAGYDSKIRAKSASGIVSVSFSSEDGNEIFTFIKDSNTMVCATVPYGYRINDFAVLDSCIFFCGKNVLNNCGYIAIFDVIIETLTIGGYEFRNIAETEELTEIIAYKVSENLPIYGSLAVARTKNQSYKTCVINLNNYYFDDYNYWKCGIGYECDNYLTDVALMWDGSSGEIVTVGQSLVVNSSQNNFISSYLPKMYIRNYKKDAVFMSDMERVLNTYTDIRMSAISPFKTTKLSGNNVVVSTVTKKNKLQNLNGVEIKRINLDNMEINNIQFIDNTPGTLKEMTYLSNGNRLAILKENTSEIDEIFIANLSKLENYTTSKIYRNNTSFNSISNYDDTHFLATGVINNTILSSLSVLQTNVNNFSTSECINKENIQVSSEVKSIYPSSSPIDPVPAFNCTIAIELGFPVIYETTVGVKCLSYFK